MEINKGGILVSSDIENLYTSVPITETIEIIRHKYHRQQCHAI